MSNYIPCFTFDALVWPVRVVYPRDMSSGGCTPLPTKEVTDPNELHSGEETEGLFEGTGITKLYLDQDPQAALKNKIGNFDEAELQKPYAQVQVKYD